MNTIAINAQVDWVVSRTGSSTWMGVCDALGLTLEGETEEELHSLVHEAQHHLFAGLFEDDELEMFLRDRGWTKTGAMPTSPEDGLRFDVPTSFLARSHAA